LTNNKKGFWKTIKTKCIATWAKTQDATALLFRYASRKARQFILPIQRLFGYSIIKDQQDTKRADLSAFLSDTDKKIAELPDEYLQWFKNEKVYEPNLYVNVASQKTIFKSAIEGWGNGLGTNLIIVGERGGGKSSLVSLLANDLETFKSLVVEVKDTTTEAEKLVSKLSKELGLEPINKAETLIKRINKFEEKKVVFLEGLQNLFLRHINGFEALDALWLILSETKEQIFWVITCSRYAWDFLTKAESLEANFAYTLDVDQLGSEDIETLILNRHEKTGYKLIFDSNENLRKSRGYKKRIDNDEELQNYLKEQYFEKLADIAEGNSSIAIIFWIRSIAKIEDKSVYIEPKQIASLDMIEKPTADVLFALASLILHDSLKVQDLSRSLNMRLSDARVLLKRLQSRGVLMTDENGNYSINRLIYRQSLRALKERNIIH